MYKKSCIATKLSILIYVKGDFVVSDYIRLISYLNLYRDGEKHKNCGFAKVDSRNNVLRLYVNIQVPFVRDSIDCDIYFITRQNDEIVGIKVGNTKISSGRGCFGACMKSDDIGHKGISIREMCGIYITMSGSSVSNNVVASEWDDKPIITKKFRIYEEKSENISKYNIKPDEFEGSDEVLSVAEVGRDEDIVIDSTDSVDIQKVYNNDIEKENNCDSMQVDNDANADENVERIKSYMYDVAEDRYEVRELDDEVNSCDSYTRFQIESNNNEDDKFWHTLEKRCVKIRPFDGYKECIKMKPNDIVCLPKRFWNLGQNSFLLHGYYNYRYLVAIRYSEGDKEKYLIGVPGRYCNNDKVMAKMFGFNNFIENKNDKEKGYWCMNLE